MKKKYNLLAGLLALVAIAWFLAGQGGTLQAAPAYTIRIGSESVAGTGDYVMKRKTVTATYTDSNNVTPTVASIKWSVSNSDILQITGGTNAASVNLKALKAGTVDLTAEIVADTETVTTTRTIVVGYAIDENPDNGFTLNEKISKDSIMVLKPNQSGKLDFIFPATDEVTWKVEDERVVSMSDNGFSNLNKTGYFRAVGTGKTEITASYKNAEGKLANATVEVYVGPEISYTGSTVSGGAVSGTVVVEDGDLIHVGAILGDTNKVLTQRIEWVVKDREDKVIATSLDTPKELIAASPYHSYLTVKARAGEYHVDVYTAGTYSKGVISDSILCKSFTLQVKAACKDYVNTNSIYLQVNDTYDIAEVFNMTEEDFAECFEVTIPAEDGAAKYTYDGKGKITGEKEGKQNIQVKVKAGKAAKIQSLMADGSIPEGKIYQIEVNIYSSFKLDRSSVDLAEGASLQLKPIYGIIGQITWSSSNDSYVKVDQNGIITGVKATSGGIIVTASMKLTDGRTLKATCSVTVHVTAEEIILSEKELRLQTGQSSTITATFNPSGITSIPGMQWLLTDEEIVDLDVNSEKSVIVTAKKAGTTILTAVNEDNFVSAYCTITVLSPISDLSLDAEEMIVKLSQEAIKFHATYNSDATDVKLKWTSSDSSVAKVDETGFVELLGAGTTMITVIPEWNPNNVMAQCRLTVLQSATGFALDKRSLTLEVGQKELLKPAVQPDKASSTITWKALNSSIASVDGEGNVTAVAAGQAYVVANTENGLVDNCLVTVTQKATGVQLSDYNITINVGESYTVTAKPNPTTSTEKEFTWTCKDPSIATVKNDGTVTGVSAGSTIVLIKTKNGDVTYLYVTVKDKAKGMELNYSTKSVPKGSSFTLKPIFTPSNTTNKKVTWTSSNTGVAKVSDKGKVTGVKGGSAIITCVSEDGGYVATCLVTVVQPVSTVKLNHSSYKLGLGKSVTLKATVTSNTSSNPKVKWTSSNTKIATVSSSGKVTGKKLGTCTITATATDGSKKKASCKITVVRQSTSVKLNKSYLTLIVGHNSQLKATVKPSNATYKTVNWKSSNESVALVNNSGLVRGIAVGSANIKVTTKDNGKKTASCYVEVIEPIPATSIMVADKNMVMIRGESQMLSYTIVPSNSTDSVKFASGNKNVATVSSSGRVYARRAGATSITITTSSGKQSVIQLHVIGLNKTSVTLEQYDTETIYVDGSVSGVSWYSANPSIATVVNGKIVGRKVGTTYVYAKVSGITLRCKVTVKKIS